MPSRAGCQPAPHSSSCSSRKFYDFQADGAGLFGVELDSVDVGGFEGGGVGEFVGAGGAGSRVFGDVVAVGEVDVGAGREIVDQFRARARLPVRSSPCGELARRVGSAARCRGRCRGRGLRGLLRWIRRVPACRGRFPGRALRRRCVRSGFRVRPGHPGRASSGRSGRLRGAGFSWRRAGHRHRGPGCSRSRVRRGCSARCADCRRRNRRWRS